jgi:hypothetical protein
VIIEVDWDAGIATRMSYAVTQAPDELPLQLIIAGRARRHF